MKSTFKTLALLMAAACMLLASAACETKTADAGIDCQASPGMTREKSLTGRIAPEVKIDLGESTLYTRDERYDAMLAVRSKFASFAGCELHSIRYAGDDANSEENLKWLNSLRDDAGFTQVAEFLSDFHSPVEDGEYAWERDMEYTDYQWWLARKKGGGWVVVSWGY